jgi:hypothetical protein
MTIRGAVAVFIVASFCLGPSISGADQSPQVAPSPTAPAYSPAPWLADLHQLIDAMEDHYADLDWAVKVRHMDLPALRARTENEIRDAGGDAAAKLAIARFLRAFGDGHLWVTWPSNQASSSPATTGNRSLCQRLGYKAPANDGIDFSLTPGFTKVPGRGEELFSGGLLKLRDHGKVGIIRLASLTEHGFPGACEQVVAAAGLRDLNACDDGCRQLLAIHVANALTQALVSRAQELRTSGATALLVDLTNNNGGDDWYEAAVRTLSPVRLVDARRGFIRSAHWTAELEGELRDVEADRQAGAQPTQVLDEAANRLRKAIAESERACDRHRAFADGSITCSSTVDDALYWSGVLPYAKPGSFSGLRSRATLFEPLEYEYAESVNHLPLLLAIDGRSFSSAERFASLVQDNGAGTIIGEISGGAGCGFTNGGIPTTLEHSRGDVRMPDCVGFRRDGSNGNDGVIPDVLVPWATRDTSFTRAEKFVRYLDRAAHSGAW